MQSSLDPRYPLGNEERHLGSLEGTLLYKPKCSVFIVYNVYAIVSCLVHLFNLV